ncbi:VCBS repeat domain-containing M23 family metallopeptidase [Plantactinospora sp. S1510]|uniref:VCBS repeat domain-containing M23 family metallopeptidase n=2 Tax=Plantactinospora alkalitolerans TaxID=2789879 RepID=A0ABS0H0N8_9ACTN|nr:peptidoglycan DD-metalloendopeptidase family protein [Plantactinospora alkalitolerans]MBF9132010.1 VCBS repeat domain-containing M23 family metallopeptidase [Plantactinospora alkalitolerans]
MMTSATLVTVDAYEAEAAGPRPLFQLPFPCGESWLLQTYRGHDDYDIDMTPTSGNSWGRPILAAYQGTVVSSGIDGTLGGRTPANPNGPMGTGGGYFVKIDHGNGWRSLYLHMLEAPMVRVGDTVSRGRQLGKVGSTGSSSGPHLHFEQQRDGAKVESWFNGIPSGITTDGYPDGEPLSPAVTRVSNNCGGPQSRTMGDYNGDGHSDLALYRRDPVNGSTWWVRSGAADAQILADHHYGGSTDIPAPGDYNGDGITDLALFRRDCTNGSTWWIKNGAAGNQILADFRYGGCNDIPAPGDYNGDGVTDLALYRRDCTNGSAWNIYSPHTNTHLRSGLKYGGCNDIPAPGDYNADGATDLALYRPDCTNGSAWNIYSPHTNTHLRSGLKYGGCNDIPAPGDYNADGATDLILYRRDCTNGSNWNIYSPHTNTQLRSGLKYGGCNDIPAASNPATT